MAEDIEFQQGDLDGVMERFDHVNQWVSDFEEKYGTRPFYYGKLDRAANQGDLNLIYHLRGPLFAHIYRPADEEEGAGTTLWFAIEPQLNEDEDCLLYTSPSPRDRG